MRREPFSKRGVLTAEEISMPTFSLFHALEDMEDCFAYDVVFVLCACYFAALRAPFMKYPSVVGGIGVLLFFGRMPGPRTRPEGTTLFPVRTPFSPRANGNAHVREAPATFVAGNGSHAGSASRR